MGLSRLASAAALLVLACMASSAFGAAEAPRLSLPIACEPNKTCWVVHYVDRDSGNGKKDYRCGGLTYDGHKGTDIAIRDLAEMAVGVPVLAAADGMVAGFRDGMRDVNVRDIGGAKALGGKDCGNGVRLDHGGGWSTQYCHMRRGSVAVGSGEKVKRGQRLGLVGLSGRTEFPHVHVTVRRDGAVVDPFVGVAGAEECALGAAPLWRDEVLERLQYRGVHLFNAGFATARPDRKAAQRGELRDARLGRDAPALILWVEAFWPRSGDVLSFRITDAAGRKVLSHRRTLNKGYVRGFYFAGVRAPSGGWAAGAYRGEVRLVRQKGEADAVTRTVTLD